MAYIPQDERDWFVKQSDWALAHGDKDPILFYNGVEHSRCAALWIAEIDPADTRVKRELGRVARMSVILAKCTGSTEFRITLDSKRIAVKKTLPSDVLSESAWARGLWAATAVGDAKSAFMLAGLAPQTLPNAPTRTPASPMLRPESPGELALARLLAAFWTQQPDLPARLIDALERTDPARATFVEGDRLLYICIPILKVFERLLEGDFDGANRELHKAMRDHIQFSKTHNDGFPMAVSVKLTAMARLLRGFHASVATTAPIAKACLTEHPLLGCGKCAAPIDEDDTQCWRCERSLVAGAVIELNVSALFDPERSCRACSKSIHPFKGQLLGMRNQVGVSKAVCTLSAC